jgi:hypothetical protein
MIVSSVNIINYSQSLRDRQAIMRCIEAMKAISWITIRHTSQEYNQESSTSEDFPSTSDDIIARSKRFKKREINTSIPEGGCK